MYKHRNSIQIINLNSQILICQSCERTLKIKGACASYHDIRVHQECKCGNNVSVLENVFRDNVFSYDYLTTRNNHVSIMKNNNWKIMTI